MLINPYFKCSFEYFRLNCFFFCGSFSSLSRRYHDDITPKCKIYEQKMIDSNDDQCPEAQNTRRQILSYFEHVSSFLMPHPGKKVSAASFRGQSDLIDDDFLEVVKEFVPFVFSISNIGPKKGSYIFT